MTTGAVLGIGAAFGVLGQLLRALLGLKKIWDSAPAGAKFSALFDARRFGISLLLGLAVGAITGLFTAYLLGRPDDFSREQVLLLISSGYAGTDALEGLLRPR